MGEKEWQEAEAAIVGADDAAGTLRFYENEQKAAGDVAPGDRRRLGGVLQATPLRSTRKS